MMRATILVMWTVLCWAATSPAQTLFDRTYGTAACYDEGYGAWPVNDSVLLVSTAYNCLGGSAEWVSKILYINALTGDSLSSTDSATVNGYLYPYAGDYLFLGGNHAGLAYDSVALYYADTNGAVTWRNNLFYAECNNQGYHLNELSDGSVLITGIYSADSCQVAPRYRSFIRKVLPNGQTDWSKTYGDVDDSQLFATREMSNGNLVSFGWKRTSLNGLAEYWLLFTNSNGDSLYSVTDSAGLYDNFGFGMDLTHDNQLILVGYSDSTYATLADINGSTIWRQNLGIPSGGRYFKALETSDQHYLFLICRDSPNGCESHLLKLSPNGTLLWDKTWGGLMRDVVETSPGSFLLTGYSGIFPNKTDVHVVRFDTTVIPTAIPEPSPEELQVTLYPNPAGGSVCVMLSPGVISSGVERSAQASAQPTQPLRQAQGDSRFELYNLLGEAVLTQPITATQTTIPLNLPEGVYIYKIFVNNNLKTTDKLVVVE